MGARVTLGSNSAALRVQRQLSATQSRLGTSLERLSSGLRINRASDDAAGLAIAESLRADAQLYSQAIKNINDGISALAIADSAVDSLGSIVTRIIELAEQAANGTNSFQQRRAMNDEALELKDEFKRIIETTSFNGLQLIDGTAGAIAYQAGITGDATSQIHASIGTVAASTVADGTFGDARNFGASGNVAPLAVGDINNDGHLDLVGAIPTGGGAGVDTLLGNGDGTFQSAKNSGFSERLNQIELIDLDGDGNLDMIGVGQSGLSAYRGDGAGGFAFARSFDYGQPASGLAVADFNGDGLQDVAFALDSGASTQLAVAYGTGTSLLSQAVNIDFGGADPTSVSATDINNDGTIDLVIGIASQKAVMLITNDGAGNFSSQGILETGVSVGAAAVGDFNGDHNIDIAAVGADGFGVSYGNGNGTFGAFSAPLGAGAFSKIAVGDVNEDGIDDIFLANSVGGNRVTYTLGGLDGLSAGTTLQNSGTSPFGMALGDFNEDGALDLSTTVTGAGFDVFLSNATEVGQLDPFSLLTADSARAALDQLKAKLGALSSAKGTIGASISRLATAARHNATTAENVTAARSRIQDVDVAREAATLARENILQQAGVQILAQANQAPAIALQLLGR